MRLPVDSEPEGECRRWGIFSPEEGIIGVIREMTRAGRFEVLSYPLDVLPRRFEVLSGPADGSTEDRPEVARFADFAGAQEHARQLLADASKRAEPPEGEP